MTFSLRHSSLIILQPCLFGWNPWHHPALDPYRAIMVDTLHQADLGVLKFCKDAVERNCKELHQVNENIQWMSKNERWSGFSLSHSKFWGDVSTIPGAHYRKMWEVVRALCLPFLAAREMDLLTASVAWHKAATAKKFTSSDLQRLQGLADE